MDMNQLLDTLYSDAQKDPEQEKTAEAAFHGAIHQDGDNPFDDMSMDELLKLAQDLTDDSGAVHDEGEDADFNKTAAAMFGGQLMAHAVVHELGLIKEAVANGSCRVCKTNTLDVEASSVCSACMGG
jgi:hypothetical protein